MIGFGAGENHSCCRRVGSVLKVDAPWYSVYQSRGIMPLKQPFIPTFIGIHPSDSLGLVQFWLVALPTIPQMMPITGIEPATFCNEADILPTNSLDRKEMAPHMSVAAVPVCPNLIGCLTDFSYACSSLRRN